MQALRRARALIPRGDNKSNIEHCPRHFGQPRTVCVERIRPRCNSIDVYSENSPPPPYTPSTNPFFNQAFPPPPSYSTVDHRTSQPMRPYAAPPSARTREQPQINSQTTIDQIVRRIRESMRNPNSWRAVGDGQQCFFWALRCEPGAADILDENMDQIKNRVLLGADWRVEKFCIMFKGQKLVDLWCRPVQTTVFFFFVQYSDLTEKSIS